MKEMTLDEFVRRIRRMVKEHPDNRFCTFLGAGSSRSSGIPMAGQLVERWLPKLKELKTGSDNDLWTWANLEYPDIEQQPSIYYGEIIEDLFITPQERQQEIERITTGKDPSFGYAVLGMLMSHERYGPHLNMVITTNFDDMVADALYLYTKKKPLVITHEALSGFVRPSRLRPLVVKIHGDAQLAPKNTSDETNLLDTKMQRAVQRVLRDTGLIFTGYAGADESVVKLLDETDTDSLLSGIYWVNTKMPTSEAMCEWLEKRQAVWVKHLDFDQLMLALWQVFELKHPDMSRFDQLKETYEKTFNELRGDLEERARQDPEALSKETALTEGLKRAGDELNWWDIETEARKYKASQPERAEAIYREGIKTVPDSLPLVANFANFLTDTRKNHDEAEILYKKVLELEPENINNLGNYAKMKFVLGDDAKALQLLEKAETSHKHPTVNIELLFYRFAHLPNGRALVLQDLKEALNNGVRSPDWVLSNNVEVATQKGHPQPALLAALAKVISDEEPIETLEAFQAWQDID